MTQIEVSSNDTSSPTYCSKVVLLFGSPNMSLPKLMRTWGTATRDYAMFAVDRKGSVLGTFTPRHLDDQARDARQHAVQDDLIGEGCGQVHSDLGLQLDHPSGNLDEAQA